MIKKLFFTAALLVPGLAYGADPSANLPIQIVPAAAVPAAAQAAGFNTLIINDNFQDPSFANPATWYDCAGASSPLYWRAWVGFGTNIDGPCSAITQATDPLTGQSALRIHWQDSYFSGLGSGHAFGTMIQTAADNGVGRLVPPGFYIEVVARTDLLNVSGSMDLWSLTPTAGDYEIDGLEEFGSAGSMQSNIHNPWASGGAFNNCARCVSCPPQGCGFDLTQYHTYAWRQTSGGTDKVFCAYYDGVLAGCQTIMPNSTQLAGFPMLHQVGSYATNGGRPIGNGNTGKNTWIKSVKVWSCAGLNSGAQCNSSSNNP